MGEDQEVKLTFAIEGPIKVGFCEDVPTLQRLCRKNYARYEYVLKRLIKARKQKNEWKQRALDLGYLKNG